jgi:hypothetical protein
MPALDEGILRDLMHRATSDLHAPAALSGQIIARQRRRRQIRAAGVTVTGVAAAAAVAVAVTGTGAAGPAGPRSGTAVRLTAAQQTLGRLSSKAAAAAQPSGRYVEMKEQRGRDRQTTIVDTATGATWTLPGPHGKPLFSPHALPTAAQLAAYPTRVPALRALLMAQARRQQAQALRLVRRQLAALPPRERARKRLAGSRAGQPRETSDDRAFSQAAYLLWDPVVGPSLRAALLRVIAATPGVQVNAHARDDAGRPAVEISRYDSAAQYTEAVFESPDAGAVLETVSIRAATPAAGGRPAQPGYRLSDVYLSVTRLSARPAAARGHS